MANFIKLANDGFFDGTGFVRCESSRAQAVIGSNVNYYTSIVEDFDEDAGRCLAG